MDCCCNQKRSQCVCVCARECVGIILVLICNSVAPSPFIDKLLYLAASDASITVMNDTAHINTAPSPSPLQHCSSKQE